MTKAYDTLSIDYENVEQKLQDREANLRELLSSIPAAVYACDTDGRIIYYNRRAAELSGCEAAFSERISGLDGYSVCDRDPVPALPANAPMKAVLASGQAVVNRGSLGGEDHLKTVQLAALVLV